MLKRNIKQFYDLITEIILLIFIMIFSSEIFPLIFHNTPVLLYNVVVDPTDHPTLVPLKKGSNYFDMSSKRVK